MGGWTYTPLWLFFVKVLQLVQYRSFQLGCFWLRTIVRKSWICIRMISLGAKSLRCFNYCSASANIWGVWVTYILFISYFENVYIGSEESTLTVAGILVWQQFSYFYEKTTTKSVCKNPAAQPQSKPHSIAAKRKLVNDSFLIKFHCKSAKYIYFWHNCNTCEIGTVLAISEKVIFVVEPF